MSLIAASAIAIAVALQFLCDDAYIYFRYAANALAGHGLVWNAPPFVPVEGCTGLLWPCSLWLAWSLLGLEPPVAANLLSMGFGLGQFAALAIAALAIRSRTGALLPRWLGLLVLAIAVSNRTFLQWWSSGLDTALYHLFVIAWVLWAFRRERRSAAWLAGWSTLAALAAMSRPDGLLFAAATFTCAAARRALRRSSTRVLLVGVAPLAMVLVYELWRRWFYGEWLPNTYYAKVASAWPEAGVTYLASFVAENGMWLLPIVAAPWLAVAGWRVARRSVDLLDRLAPIAAVSTLVAHVAYYTLRVGGDHFEYRVFAHLPPLAALAIAAMAARASSRPLLPAAAIGAFALATSVAWLHLAWTSPLPPHGFQPVAARAPAMLRPLARWFDRQQAWLLFHNIGLRCAHHADVLERFQRPFPGRLTIPDPPDPFPIFTTGAVGVVGWCLPDCAILDHHGLNDWVVARTPLPAGASPLNADALRPFLHGADGDHDGWLDRGELRGALALLNGGDDRGSAEGAEFLVEVMLAIHARERADAMSFAEAEGIGDMLSRARSMAHERHPPPGYFEAFEPNVVVAGGVATARPRQQPLTAERIREIEASWRGWVERGAPPDALPQSPPRDR